MRQYSLIAAICFAALAVPAAAQDRPARETRPSGITSTSTTGVQLTSTAVVFADGTQQTTASTASAITSITPATGGGLVGGGNAGALYFGLTTSCGAGQLLKWNAGVWGCADDATSGGGVSSITAGSGLTGGTITSTGTLAVDNTVVRSTDSRLSDSRTPLAGSSAYIQSSPAQAQAADISITGNISSGAVSTGSISATGTITGSGAGLTYVPAAVVVGAVGSAVNASYANGVRAATSASTCDSTSAGAAYLNTTTNTLRYCNGTAWLELAAYSSAGSLQGTVALTASAASCTATTAGTLDYSGSTVRYCNGFAWVSVAAGYGSTTPYCGASYSSTNGAIQVSAATGYQAAKSMCEQTCGSTRAHMCSSDEMVHSAQMGFSPPAVWYSSGLPSWGAATTGDCAAWKTNSNTAYGPAWGSNGAQPLACSNFAQIACCL